ncbi:CPLX1 [Branchiostoma lanceolatum]|uniref:CPLX1 protein n=1 Tax=Branchiostoma lanceolatum TaxID=7740 RepID=A0A8J9ZQY5_BRALA|nr:CPLX1 [Branchiostoma lanceolatum]
MAAFLAKQMLGDQMKELQNITGGGKDEEGDGEKKELTEDGQDPEVAEALRQQEEARKEKHRKMEEEREKVRSTIRDKYGLKKKEKEQPQEEQQQEEDEDGVRSLTREKKPPPGIGEEEEEEEGPLDELWKMFSEKFPSIAEKFSNK